MRLVFCTFYKNLRRDFSACIFLKRKQPPGPSPCQSRSLSALPYSSAPAKECEFIDLIFIGKTRASSCRVCESVVWVCMCSPQPLAGGQVHGRGLKGCPHSPFAHKSLGVSRCGVVSQGSGAAHLACSSLPTPCPLGWAQRQGSEVDTSQERDRGLAPSCQLKADALATSRLPCSGFTYPPQCHSNSETAGWTLESRPPHPDISWTDEAG